MISVDFGYATFIQSVLKLAYRIRYVRFITCDVQNLWRLWLSVAFWGIEEVKFSNLQMMLLDTSEGGCTAKSHPSTFNLFAELTSSREHQIPFPQPPKPTLIVGSQDVPSPV